MHPTTNIQAKHTADYLTERAGQGDVRRPERRADQQQTEAVFADEVLRLCESA